MVAGKIHLSETRHGGTKGLEEVDYLKDLGLIQFK